MCFLSCKVLHYGKVRISFRNNKGHALAHRGGGHKKNYRLVDFYNIYWHLVGVVHFLSYDPNRSGFLAFLAYPNGVVSYVLAAKGLAPGSLIYSGFGASLRSGSRFYLWELPLGSVIFSISSEAGGISLYARAGGCAGLIIRKTQRFIVIQLPSRELKTFSLTALCTLGQCSNSSNIFCNKRKAGSSRLLGRKPVVRGVAKNPVDHPHGGGEGKSSGGRPSVTPWGVITKGFPTRKKKVSSKRILRYSSGVLNKHFHG